MTQGQRYQTVVEFRRTLTINNVKCFSVIKVVEEESGEDLEIDSAGWSPALPLACGIEESSTKEDPQLEEIKNNLLSKFPKIVFTNEKNATITDRVQCKLYMKSERLIRSGI